MLGPGGLAGEVSACNQARRSWIVAKPRTIVSGCQKMAKTGYETGFRLT